MEFDSNAGAKTIPKELAERTEAHRLLQQIIHQAYRGNFLKAEVLHQLAAQSPMFSELWLAHALASSAAKEELILACFYAEHHQLEVWAQLQGFYHLKSGGDADFCERLVCLWLRKSSVNCNFERIAQMVAAITDPLSSLKTMAAPHASVAVHQIELNAVGWSYFQNYAEHKLESAKLYTDGASQQVLDRVRNNTQYISPLPSDNVLLSALTRLLSACHEQPLSHAEPLIFYRYEAGQQFDWHHDYIIGESDAIRNELKTFGQRQTTSILYMNDGFAGGSTEFKYWNCQVKPDAGGVVSFANATRQGTPVVESLHRGAPVVSGEKWIATLWSRSQPNWLRRGILQAVS